MSDDFLNEINKDLGKLAGKKSFSESWVEQGAGSAKWTAIFAGFCFAAQFGIVNPLHDEEPYMQATEQLQNNTLIVPESYYADDQETCIKDKLADNTTIQLDLDDMDQDEIISLKYAYTKALDGCLDDDFQDDETQKDYVQSLEHPDPGFGAFGMLFSTYSVIFASVYGSGALRRYQVQKAIDKRERDRKAFDL